MDRKIGRSSSRARASASGPQGYQSTGLWACWRRYGLVSPARRFSGIGSMVRTTLVARLRLRSADALYDLRTRERAGPQVLRPVRHAPCRRLPEVRPREPAGRSLLQRVRNADVGGGGARPGGRRAGPRGGAPPGVPVGSVGGLQLRVGVLTGEAAVTVGAQGEGMVAGDLVNTASRLQSAAAAGEVLVGEATLLAASDAITFEPAGDQTVKGKALPVAAWRAGRVVAGRKGMGRTTGIEPPFVVRDHELQLLKDLYHATARERRARLVSLVGIAGIGKSRLAWELEKYLDGLAQDVFWHQGRSPSYGDGVTFWALGEMVRRRAGLAEGDDEATTRAKVAATLAEYVADDDERHWIAPRSLALLGPEEGPPGPRGGGL